MNQETKVFIGIGVITVAILIGAVFLFSKPQSVPQAADTRVVLCAQQQSVGPENSQVTLIEFSDFQCPACKAAWPTVEALTKAYPNQLRFVYRHFPLPQHKFAKDAAYAAEAAGKQGKFWEMSNLLFENQESISPELFPKLADELRLDLEQFKKDMESQEIKDKVEADLNDARTLGVNSTPTFYLNGTKVNLANFDDLKTQVEKSLR